MNYENKFENVSVLGAGGKMGKGILLLVAMEAFQISIKPENKNNDYQIFAYDTSMDALSGLEIYIHKNLRKIAEKRIDYLKKIYQNRCDLDDNSKIISEYISMVSKIIKPTTSLEEVYDSLIIFEAISENQTLKAKVLSQINNNSKTRPWFFTNTSSIPISYLNIEADLKGNILGLHFYNPPIVQKLVEVIRCKDSNQELLKFAKQYIQNINKTEIHSFDSAGFIGNGHFMRDALFGLNLLNEINDKLSFAESLYCINKVTQDYLIRPMGIFQLIDYVGIDVCQQIMKVMNSYVEENIHSPLLDNLIELGINGGQTYDGLQKNGFLKYENNKIVAYLDIETNEYLYIENISGKCDSYLGNLPDNHITWKSIINNKNKISILESYFRSMKNLQNNGCNLALRYLKNSKLIGQNLVKHRVANNNEDVNTVLRMGFYHAYGPINSFID